ncbi:MAG TPA: hypothetical protein VF831_06005, partial [Anaerolineales bacterium]
MLRTWLEPEDIFIPEEYLQIVGGNRLVSQVLFARGVTDNDAARGFIFPDKYHPTPSSELPGLEKLAGYLQDAISAKKAIGV